MIKVDFSEPVDHPGWKRWREDCQRELKELIAAFDRSDRIEVKNDLYKQMKQVMFDAFNGKCAFCETKIAETDQHGDVEHYRPKKGVTDERDQPVIVDWPNGMHRTHPGYFWLAYDWTNLLPSCVLCNQPNTTRDGRQVGKRNRFPLVSGQYACKPGDEANESPVLINPVREDPARELDIDLETGMIFGLTDRGRKCIEILDLNRDGLKDARRDLYRNLKRLWSDVYTTQNLESVAVFQNMHELRDHNNGKKAYTMVARKTIKELRRIRDERDSELGF